MGPPLCPGDEGDSLEGSVHRRPAPDVLLRRTSTAFFQQRAFPATGPRAAGPTLGGAGPSRGLTPAAGPSGGRPHPPSLSPWAATGSLTGPGRSPGPQVPAHAAFSPSSEVRFALKGAGRGRRPPRPRPSPRPRLLPGLQPRPRRGGPAALRESATARPDRKAQAPEHTWGRAASPPNPEHAELGGSVRGQR